MDNFILITDGRRLSAVEKQLAKHLPGLDARLFPFSEHQAILRGTLLQSLQIEYSSVPLARMLSVLGVAELNPISDEASATILTARSPIDLPPRSEVAVAAHAVPAVVAHDWHLEQSRVPLAWQRLGGPEQIAWGDVRVGQIDTGYTEHPAFGFPNPSIDTASAATFFPPPPPQGPTMPVPEIGHGRDNGAGVSAGHGTRMGSTIGGKDPLASGGPFYGVAPRVPLIPVRITDIVWINHAQREFAQAVRHLIAHRVGVINVSLGVFLGWMTKDLRAAVNAAYDAGVIVVCAAGNHVNSVVGPACLERTIAVAGVVNGDTPWSGSSFGPEVDFSAPAADLRRASVKGAAKFSYGFGGDGTSYAAAIASGAAALWLAHRAGEIESAYAQPWQRVEAFRTAARRSARVPKIWHPGSFGDGVLDLADLLDEPLPPAAELHQAPAA